MSNAALVNFAAGETSPRSRGRFDIASFTTSCRKLLNFIAEVTGCARFRPGFRHLAETRGSGTARMVPFQLNDSQAYMLEFTEGKMRVYKNEALVTKVRTTVTGITQANPVVVTLTSVTNLANGDEVIITGIVGMTQLNGRQVKLANGAGLTFQLVDPTTGTSINSTSFTAYSSGGNLVEIYEITSPYLASELNDIAFASTRNTIYFTHPLYAPYKLTVDSAEAFTLATYVRTNDPLVSTAATLALTAIRLGTTTRVYFLPGAVIVEGAVYTFAAIVGTVQLNGLSRRMVNVGVSAGLPNDPAATYDFAYADLKTVAGVDVDSSAWTAYASGGTATPAPDNPIAVAFYEGRLGFFGTDQRPNTFFLSRAPNNAGLSRFDDFTGGTAADDACFFSLAPASGQVDFISWAVGQAKYLLVGTFGGPFRISGGGLDQPITPSSINVRQIDTWGCEAVAPAVSARPFYIQRGGDTLRSVRYDVNADDFESYDMCLNAEQVASSGLRRVVRQAGRPDIIWILRNDGVLAGMTVQGSENIAGWHRHKVGGTNAKVIDIAALPRPDANDQIWVVVERTVNGATRRSVEVMADDVVFPDPEDFFTNVADETGDRETWANAVYRLQDRYIHVDGAGTYDGSARGTTAAATLTPGSAAIGIGVAFTASAAVFLASDVGNELWKKPSATTGVGSGRAVITAFVSSTVVTCEIIVAFNNVTAIAAGAWHIAAETIGGLWYLEGETVAVQNDGAVYSDGRGVAADYPVVTVANGQIVLADPAAVVHIGLPYDGVLQTQNLEMGGRSGPAQDKPRNIVEMFIRFMGTLGVDYGTSLYNLEAVYHRSNEFVTSRPSPAFSGIKKLPYADSWSAEGEKHVVVSQRLPLPCIVQFIDIRYETADE